MMLLLNWMLVLVMVTVTSVLGATPPRTDAACSSTCTDWDSVVHFTKNNDYKYSVRVQNVQRTDDGQLHGESSIQGEATVRHLGNCEYLLKMSYGDITDVKFNARGESVEQFTDTTDYDGRTIRFGMDNGKITGVCGLKDSDAFSMNLNKGFLSALQITMQDLKSDSYHIETDVLGNCFTQYSVASEASSQDLIRISKSKDLNSCSHRHHVMSAVFGPRINVPSGAGQDSLISSKIDCQMEISRTEAQLRTSVCRESHVLNQMSVNSEFSVNFISKTPRKATQEDHDYVFTERQSLLFSNAPGSMGSQFLLGTLTADLQDAGQLQEFVCSLAGAVGQPDSARKFLQLVTAVRELPAQKLRDLVESGPAKCSGVTSQLFRTVVFDVLASAGTAEQIRYLIESGVDSLLDQNKLKSLHIALLFQRLNFMNNPDPSIAAELLKLIDDTTHGDSAIQTASALVGSSCQRRADCMSNPSVVLVGRSLLEGLARHCGAGNGEDSAVKATTFIRAVGNAGSALAADPGLLTSLRACKNRFPHNKMVLTALTDFSRRFSCHEMTSEILDFYRDLMASASFTQVRVKAYHSAARCFNADFFGEIFSKLQDPAFRESDEQLSSFIWSHVKSLDASEKASSNQEFKKLFRSLINKSERAELEQALNHNYLTHSKFLEKSVDMPSDGSNRAAGKLEVVNIFGRQSYLPELSQVNVTVEAYGMALNVLDLTLTSDGLDTELERIRPQKRTLGRSAVSADALKGVNDLDEKLSSRFGEARLGVSARVFGQEVFHRYNVLPELQNGVEALQGLGMQFFMDGRADWLLEVQRHGILAENCVTAATISGLPLKRHLLTGYSLAIRDQLIVGYEESVKINAQLSPKLDVYKATRFYVHSQHSKMGVAREVRLSAGMDLSAGLEVQAPTPEGRSKSKFLFILEPLSASQKIFSIQRKQTFFLSASKGSKFAENNRRVQNDLDAVEVRKDSFCSPLLVETIFGAKVCFTRSAGKPSAGSPTLLELSLDKWEGFLLHLELERPQDASNYMPDNLVVKAGRPGAPETIMMLEMRRDAAQKTYRVDVKRPHGSKHSMLARWDSPATASGDYLIDDVVKASLKAFKKDHKLRVVVQSDKDDIFVFEVDKKDKATQAIINMKKFVQMEAFYVMEPLPAFRRLLNVRINNKYYMSARVASLMTDQATVNKRNLDVGFEWSIGDKKLVDYSGTFAVESFTDVASTQVTDVTGRSFSIRMNHKSSGFIGKTPKKWAVQSEASVFVSKPFYQREKIPQPYLLEVDLKFDTPETPDREARHSLLFYSERFLRNGMNLTLQSATHSPNVIGFTQNRLELSFLQKNSQDAAQTLSIPNFNVHVLRKYQPPNYLAASESSSGFEFQLINAGELRSAATPGNYFGAVLSRFRVTGDVTSPQVGLLLESDLKISPQAAVEHSLSVLADPVDLRVETKSVPGSTPDDLLLLEHQIFVRGSGFARANSKVRKEGVGAFRLDLTYQNLRHAFNNLELTGRLDVLKFVLDADAAVKFPQYGLLYKVSTRTAAVDTKVVSKLIAVRGDNPDDKENTFGYDLSVRMDDSPVNVDVWVDVFLGSSSATQSPLRLLEVAYNPSLVKFGISGPLPRDELNPRNKLGTLFRVALSNEILSRRVDGLTTLTSMRQEVEVDLRCVHPSLYRKQTSKQNTKISLDTGFQLQLDSQASVQSADNRAYQQEVGLTVSSEDDTVRSTFLLRDEMLAVQSGVVEVRLTLDSSSAWRQVVSSTRVGVNYRLQGERSGRFVTLELAGLNRLSEESRLQADFKLETNVGATTPETRPALFTVTNELVRDPGTERLQLTTGVDWNQLVKFSSVLQYKFDSTSSYFVDLSVDSTSQRLVKQINVHAESAVFPSIAVRNRLLVDSRLVRFSVEDRFQVPEDSDAMQYSINWDTDSGVLNRGQVNLQINVARMEVTAGLQVTRSSDASPLLNVSVVAGSTQQDDSTSISTLTANLQSQLAYRLLPSQASLSYEVHRSMQQFRLTGQHTTTFRQLGWNHQLIVDNVDVDPQLGWPRQFKITERLQSLQREPPVNLELTLEASFQNTLLVRYEAVVHDLTAKDDDRRQVYRMEVVPADTAMSLRQTWCPIRWYLTGQLECLLAVEYRFPYGFSMAENRFESRVTLQVSPYINRLEQQFYLQHSLNDRNNPGLQMHFLVLSDSAALRRLAFTLNMTSSPSSSADNRQFTALCDLQTESSQLNENPLQIRLLSDVNVRDSGRELTGQLRLDSGQPVLQLQVDRDDSRLRIQLKDLRQNAANKIGLDLLVSRQQPAPSKFKFELGDLVELEAQLEETGRDWLAEVKEDDWNEAFLTAQDAQDQQDQIPVQYSREDSQRPGFQPNYQLAGNKKYSLEVSAEVRNHLKMDGRVLVRGYRDFQLRWLVEHLSSRGKAHLEARYRGVLRQSSSSSSSAARSLLNLRMRTVWPQIEALSRADMRYRQAWNPQWPLMERRAHLEMVQRDVSVLLLVTDLALVTSPYKLYSKLVTSGGSKALVNFQLDPNQQLQLDVNSALLGGGEVGGKLLVTLPDLRVDARLQHRGTQLGSLVTNLPRLVPRLVWANQERSRWWGLFSTDSVTYSVDVNNGAFQASVGPVRVGGEAGFEVGVKLPGRGDKTTVQLVTVYERERMVLIWSGPGAWWLEVRSRGPVWTRSENRLAANYLPARHQLDLDLALWERARVRVECANNWLDVLAELQVAGQQESSEGVGMEARLTRKQPGSGRLISDSQFNCSSVVFRMDGEAAGQCGLDQTNGMKKRRVRITRSSGLTEGVVAWDLDSRGLVGVMLDTGSADFRATVETPVRDLVLLSRNQRAVLELKLVNPRDPDTDPVLFEIGLHSVLPGQVKISIKSDLLTKELWYRRVSSENKFEMELSQSEEEFSKKVQPIIRFQLSSNPKDSKSTNVDFRFESGLNVWKGEYRRTPDKIYLLTKEVKFKKRVYEFSWVSWKQFSLKLADSLLVESKSVRNRFGYLYRFGIKTKPDDTKLYFTVLSNTRNAKFIKVETKTEDISVHAREIQPRGYGVDVRRGGINRDPILSARSRYSSNDRLITELTWQPDLKDLFSKFLDKDRANRVRRFYLGRAEQIQTAILNGALDQVVRALYVINIKTVVEGVMADVEDLRRNLNAIYDNNEFYLQQMFPRRPFNPRQPPRDLSNLESSLSDVGDKLSRVLQDLSRKLENHFQDYLQPQMKAVFSAIVKQIEDYSREKPESRQTNDPQSQTTLSKYRAALMAHIAQLLQEMELGNYFGYLQNELVKLLSSLEVDELNKAILRLASQASDIRMDLDQFQENFGSLMNDLYPRNSTGVASTGDQANLPRFSFTAGSNSVRVEMQSSPPEQRVIRQLLVDTASGLARRWLMKLARMDWSVDAVYLRAMFLKKEFGSLNKLAQILPPYKSRAAVLENSHIVQFDDNAVKQITPGCRYLLARDFAGQKLLVTLDVNSDPKLTELTLVIRDLAFRLDGSGKFSEITGQGANQPQVLPYKSARQAFDGEVTATRNVDFVKISHPLISVGLEVQRGTWHFTVSGQLHGRLNGLLGTNNNHAYDDTNLAETQLEAAKQHSDWLNSWKLDGTCQRVETSVENMQQSFKVNQACYELFNNSEFISCRPVVDSGPFLNYCYLLAHRQVSNALCRAELAYTSACSQANVVIQPRQKCCEDNLCAVS